MNDTVNVPYKDVASRRANARKRYAERKRDGTLRGYTPVHNIRHQAWMARLRDKEGYWATRRYMLKHRYGIEIAEFFALLDAQRYACAICGNALNIEPGHQRTAHGVVIDHDHRTGEIRGLLHRVCNSWLAPLEHERGTWLRAALTYLGQHEIWPAGGASHPGSNGGLQPLG